METELKHIEALSFEEHSKMNKTQPFNLLTVREITEKYGEYLSDEEIEQIANSIYKQNSKMKVWKFMYNSSCHESAYATISIHKTKEGAESAMNKHMESIKDKHEKEEAEYKLSCPNGVDFPWNYDQDWKIEEIELLD